MVNKLLKEINSREMKVMFLCSYRHRKEKNLEAITQMSKHPLSCLQNVRTRQVAHKVTLPSYSKLSTGRECGGTCFLESPALFSKLAREAKTSLISMISKSFHWLSPSRFLRTSWILKDFLPSALEKEGKSHRWKETSTHHLVWKKENPDPCSQERVHDILACSQGQISKDYESRPTKA